MSGAKSCFSGFYFGLIAYLLPEEKIKVPRFEESALPEAAGWQILRIWEHEFEGGVSLGAAVYGGEDWGSSRILDWKIGVDLLEHRFN